MNPTDNASSGPERGTALRIDELTKTYGAGAGEVLALDRLSCRLASGTFTAVMGPSGSGKSTLLNCAAGLERATSGTVEIDGEALTGRDETALTRFRRERIGFVFQGLNLLPYLTAERTSRFRCGSRGRKADRQLCRELLDQVGLGDRADHCRRAVRWPAAASGHRPRAGDQARRCVFADEPTGALDSRSARQVLGILRGSADRLGQTIVMVTHDPVAAAYADSAVFLADGRVVGTMDEPDRRRGHRRADDPPRRDGRGDEPGMTAGAR